ncbi:phospholipase D-like domain-containing protein [Telmatobacter sp. DSM 110680]|uniref:phospholipase D n=1 Tax=Telmatobacter sp. DSM 110680 TaxID=3036704 RepID=A0AAU7DNV1_9BACT
MKLLLQPDNGIKPILDALRKAKKIIRILIFRFDRVEIEKALVAAVNRGVTVQALIAHTNQGEEKNLRRLEMRLLAEGVTVTRTADDLVRYHGKMFIIDDKMLYLLGFNFTHMDIDLSRSLGIVTSKKSVVKEAIRLFESDSKRRPYKNVKGDLVVSPVNARKQLTNFIAGTKKKLLIYEMKISDRDFLKLLQKKISSGAEVRVLSRASAKGGNISVRRLPSRLHLRAILRDGNSAFLGSQSLRKLELEARREIGLIFRDKKTVKEMEAIFEKDWKRSEPVIEDTKLASAIVVPAKKVAKEVARQISIKPVLEQVLDKVIDTKDSTPFEPEEVAQTVREAFHDEVQGAVQDALKNIVASSATDDTGKTAEKDK